MEILPWKDRSELDIPGVNIYNDFKLERMLSGENKEKKEPWKNMGVGFEKRELENMDCKEQTCI